MGNSLQQYRAAIGLFGICKQCNDDSNLTPVIEQDDDEYRDHNNEHFVVKGQWKLHATVLLIVSLSILATSLAGTCKANLLLMSGIEPNPGPVSTENQKKVLAGLTDHFKTKELLEILNSYIPNDTWENQYKAIEARKKQNYKLLA